MSSARFDILHHPAQLQIYVAAGVEIAIARRILKRAVANRRQVIRENPQAFVLYLGRELLRSRLTKQWVTCDVAERAPPANLVFRIDLSRRGPTIQILTYNTDGSIRKKYQSFFYKFVGTEVVEYKTTNKKRPSRSERLNRFKEDYKRAHGHYPDEKITPDIARPKVYSPMQRRLRAVQETNIKRIGKIKLAHIRRKIRRNKLRKITLPRSLRTTE